MVSLKVIAVSPAQNPDKIKFLATFSGNYGVNLVGDLLNLAPVSVGANAGGFTNPKNIPLPEMPNLTDVPPGIDVENIGGYYCEITPLAPPAASEGVAGGVAVKNGFGLRVFAPGGAELATNAVYPAAMIAAGTGIVLELQLPSNQ